MPLKPAQFLFMGALRIKCGHYIFSHVSFFPIHTRKHAYKHHDGAEKMQYDAQR